MKLEQYLHIEHTKESAKSYLYHIEHYLAVNPRAENYQYRDIVNYLNSLKLSDAGKRTKLASIKKYYEYLLEINKIVEHPCRNLFIKVSRKRKIHKQDLFTPNELELLLTRENRYRDLEVRNKAILSLLIYQGITSSELCKLTTDDIDLDEGTVYIKASKNLLRRTLELHPKQVLLFDKYLTEYRANLTSSTGKILFYTLTGHPITVDSLNRMISPLKGLFVDKNLNASTIRQSVISNWLNVKKYALADVQLMAGHRYPSSTEKYKLKDEAKQRNLINQFHPLQ